MRCGTAIFALLRGNDPTSARCSFSGDFKERARCGKQRAGLQEAAPITFCFTHEAQLQQRLPRTEVVRPNQTFALDQLCCDRARIRHSLLLVRMSLLDYLGIGQTTGPELNSVVIVSTQTIFA